MQIQADADGDVRPDSIAERFEQIAIRIRNRSRTHRPVQIERNCIEVAALGSFDERGPDLRIVVVIHECTGRSSGIHGADHFKPSALAFL